MYDVRTFPRPPRGNSILKLTKSSGRGRTFSVPRARVRPFGEPDVLGVDVFSGKSMRTRVIWIAAMAAFVLAAATAITVRKHGVDEPARAPFSDLLRDLDRGAVDGMSRDSD